MDDTPGRPPEPKKTTANVGSYNVDYGAVFEAIEPIRQEFTDTRRRQVKYNVTAISRFRDYFGSLTAVNPNACTVAADLEATDIPSTARPPAPALRYLMPTALWSRDTASTVIRSSRRGGRVRAFLERPWFVSGYDESLAVLAWPVGPAPNAATLRYLSLAGRDPIRDSRTPPPLVMPSHSPAPHTSEILMETGQSVEALVHSVRYDAELDCWIADIDLAALVEASYAPFVRLGLARYQALTADPKQRLSAPIVGEPIQLLPHRDLTVTRINGSIEVSVNGLGPGGARPNTVQADLQVYNGSGVPDDDNLIGPGGWTTLIGHSGSLVPQGAVLNFGAIQTGSRPTRVVVTETETHSSSTGGSANRMIYADTVALN